MKLKLIAIGNIMMGDDGIAITIAQKLEKELMDQGIEIIYGETDPFYSISEITGEDFLILLDAARLGKSKGEITVLPLRDYQGDSILEQHDIRLPDLLKLFFPFQNGVICAIEIDEISFSDTLSEPMIEKIDKITEEVRGIIRTFQLLAKDGSS